MKKALLVSLTVVVLVSGFVVFRLSFYSVDESEKTSSFTQWYEKKKQVFKKKECILTYKLESPVLPIDRIYRSMEGPFASESFHLSQNLLSPVSELLDPELLWITGYKVELVDEHGKQVSDEFMCHNNINLGQSNVLPWYTRTMGTDKRLFTLTEGETELHLPRGFGIPILSNQSLRVDFQVLNHNLKKAALKTGRLSRYFIREIQNAM